VGDEGRRGVFEKLGDPGRDGGLGLLLGASVAELFALNALLILQTVFVSASCHTVLLVM
jgi:hypothetical protein